jgi:predicted dehydrogenase
MSDQVRVAVVGAGVRGRFHAERYKCNPRAMLVAVVDADEKRAVAAADEFNVQPATDYRSIIEKVHAASVAISTPLHYEISRALLEAGIHVLVERPLAETVEKAAALAAAAEDRGLVLQVSHIERYSSAYRTLRKAIADPLYFESYRLSPWQDRVIGEEDVIVELMIHDIDIITGLTASPARTVEAVGTPVLGKGIDIANARITFESGCIANVTASRVSYKSERRMRVFGRSQYLNCDLAAGRIFAYRLRGDPMTEGIAAIATETYQIEEEDSLANAIDAFLDCVSTGTKPLVNGWAGYEALRIASMINSSIAEHLNKLQGNPGGSAAGAVL